MESNQRFYMRRAAEERTAAQRAVTEQARSWHAKLASEFAELVDFGKDKRLALMCSEAVWWRCHRRIITDYLLLNGHEVDHLMGPGQVDTATPTPGAQRTAQGKVVYPARLA